MEHDSYYQVLVCTFDRCMFRFRVRSQRCAPSDLDCPLERAFLIMLACVQGLLAALVGVVSDPVAGFKQGSVPGLVVGTAKGMLGLGMRPIGGFTEFCSKSCQGLALVCLGRQGIQGRHMRRVYAPGTTRHLHDQLVRSYIPLLGC